MSFYSLTLATNFFATALLAYRIWKVDQEVASVCTTRSNTLQPAMKAIIDSGALYSVALLTIIILYASNSTGQYIVLDMVMPIISISFYMIIFRLGIARDRTLRGQSEASDVVVSGNDKWRGHRLQLPVTHDSEFKEGLRR